MNRSTRHDSLRCARGFTFAELVIVVLVISIMAVVAVPKYADSMDRYRVEATAMRVAADLALARKHAQATSTSQKVQFAVSDDSYVLTRMADPDRSENEYKVELKKTGYPAALTMVKFRSGDNVTFDQYGKPDSEGSIRVEAGSEQRTITVNAITGKASVN